MPICPWPHLIVFVFGAGSALLAISLVGCVAFNGKFGDDNKFTQYNYGLDTKISKLAISNVSLGMFATVFLMLAIGFNIKHLPDPAQLVMWILALLAFLGTILSQVLSITCTKYGDVLVPSEYSYYDDAEFKAYVDKYFPEVPRGANGVNGKFVWQETTIMGNATVNFTLQLPTSLNMDTFYVSFFVGYNMHSVPSCVINWDPPATQIIGFDPCNFVIKETACIGQWNGELFKNYWCYEYRSNKTTSKDLAGKSDAEVEKYYAAEQRQQISVDSKTAFYEINAIFMGLECAGFVVTVIALFLNMCVQPFDKKSISYKKIEASGSGSGRSSSTKKGKGRGSSSGSASMSGSASKKSSSKK